MKEIMRKIAEGENFTNKEVVRVVRELSRNNISDSLKGMFVTIFKMSDPTTNMNKFGRK